MKNPKICIVDYEVGNIFSVANAIKYLGYSHVKISKDHSDINNADALILPGVGAFETCMQNLIKNNLVEVLNHTVLENKTPILGICVGMQLLATQSQENGTHQGLGWIKGVVKKLDINANLVIPHVGWNNVKYNNTSILYLNQNENPNFYFDHSYYFDCEPAKVTGFCEYDINVTASVQKDNIHGVQFHPEKSQNNGLRLFRNFFNHI